MNTLDVSKTVTLSFNRFNAKATKQSKILIRIIIANGFTPIIFFSRWDWVNDLTRNNGLKMDVDTLVLLVATFAAFCWWFKFQLDDNKRLVRELEKKEQDRIEREQRVKRLMNRK